MKSQQATVKATGIKVRGTRLNREIWQSYLNVKGLVEGQNQQMEATLQLESQSLSMFSVEYAMIKVGAQNKAYFIQNLSHPILNGLDQAAHQVLSSQPKNDQLQIDIEFFKDTYRQCYQYIHDNQSRFLGLGAANLQDLSHGKVFAIDLLAHLCKQGITGDEQSRQNYKHRVEGFVETLLAKEYEAVVKSGSDGTTTTPCHRVLVKTRHKLQQKVPVTGYAKRYLIN